MNKIFYFLLFLFFFGYLNLGIAQNTSKKNEFSIFSGISQSTILFHYGNNLGVEAHHLFTKKIGISASINLANGYKNHSDKYGKVRPFFYSNNELELTFAPFKKGNWRFSAGVAHQYLPDVSFLGNSVFFEICTGPIPSSLIIEEVARRAKVNPMDLHLFGYSFSIQRKIRINASRNLLIRFDNSFFNGDARLHFLLDKPGVTNLSVGWVF
jgi:hypothetical protein